MMHSKAIFHVEGGQGMFQEGLNEDGPDAIVAKPVDLAPAWARVRARLRKVAQWLIISSGFASRSHFCALFRAIDGSKFSVRHRV